MGAKPSLGLSYPHLAGSGPTAFGDFRPIADIHCLWILRDYLGADVQNVRHERFQALFLTTKNELSADDLVWDGAVGQEPANPREMVKRALELGDRPHPGP